MYQWVKHHKYIGRIGTAALDRHRWHLEWYNFVRWALRVLRVFSSVLSSCSSAIYRPFQDDRLFIRYSILSYRPFKSFSISRMVPATSEISVIVFNNLTYFHIVLTLIWSKVYEPVSLLVLQLDTAFTFPIHTKRNYLYNIVDIHTFYIRTVPCNVKMSEAQNDHLGLPVNVISVEPQRVSTKGLHR